MDVFDQSLNDLRRNRYFVDEKYDPFKPPPSTKSFKVKIIRRTKWKVENSPVWGNRGAYFETDEMMRKMFECDWNLARQSHGLEKLIIKNDDNRHGDPTQEVEEVMETLWKYHHGIYGAFDYYASLHVDLKHNGFECDVFNITFNSFLAFIRDCKLATKGVSTRDLETIWVQVNAFEKNVADIDKFNQARTMNRQEFLQLFVHMALTRYVKKGKTMDFSDAVDEMLRRDIIPNLPGEAAQNSNLWRKKFPYTEHVDLVLRRHIDSLSNLYSRYAELEQDNQNRLISDRTMSIGEWLGFVSHLGFLKNGFITQHEARLIFMWSRVRALDGYSEVAERKLRNLAFHDFVEAIVRLSLMVPLPTDKEIKEVTARDAGEYIITLQEACSKTFGDFVLKNKRTFDQEPKQKVQRCVEHLLNLIARIIEQNTGGTQDLKIDEHEADQFLKRMRAGNQLRRKAASLGGADLVAAFEGAQDAVRRKLFDSLREVMVFSGLSDSQVEMLRDAMMLAPFDTGDYIFEQDEDGDTFYVITKGEAKVLRTEDENEPDKVLAELKEGAYFGERALLKNDRRFASVMAVTELETMCITREGFENVLGPLQDLVPDHY